MVKIHAAANHAADVAVVRRLGVFGWPVAHSRSPAMQNAALAAVGLKGWHYQRLPVPPALFAAVARGLPAVGFIGANVTIPHKQQALALADEATVAARAIGAANTLSFRADGTIAADNTDAPGLVAALGRPVARSTVLVLGAGGSARAAVWALLQAGAARIAVWNRTAARARALSALFAVDAVDRPVKADILVNCTSVGLSGNSFKNLPFAADWLSKYEVVVDLVYRPGGTELLRQAAQQGCSVIDGVEILVNQGALSFTKWTGTSAPIAAMRGAAVAALAPYGN